MGRECGHRSLSTGRVSVGTGALLRGELVWTREPFQGESQRGHGSLSTGRVSVDTGAFPRGETVWTWEPFHRVSQHGHGSLSEGRVSMDTGRAPGFQHGQCHGQAQCLSGLGFFSVHSVYRC